MANRTCLVCGRTVVVVAEAEEEAQVVPPVVGLARLLPVHRVPAGVKLRPRLLQVLRLRAFLQRVRVVVLRGLLPLPGPEEAALLLLRRPDLR